MPVTTAKKGGKWRVVESGGGIALNAAGTPLDGGGHASETHAASQARAVNASLRRQGKIKSNELKSEVVKSVIVRTAKDDECVSCLSTLVGGELTEASQLCMGCSDFVKSEPVGKQAVIRRDPMPDEPGFEPYYHRPFRLVYSCDEYGWPVSQHELGVGTVGLPIHAAGQESVPSRHPYAPEYGTDYENLDGEPWWRDLYKTAPGEREPKAKPLILLLVRHGEPEELSEGVADDARSLTKEGAEKMRKAFRGLERLGVVVDRTVASPTARTKETAELLSKTLGDGSYRVESALHNHDFDAKTVCEEIEDAPAGSTLAFVGHSTWLGPFTSLLVHGPKGKGSYGIKYAHGSIGRVEFENQRVPGKGQLTALFLPRTLRKLVK